MTKKKPEPNPIEKAIGARAKAKEDLKEVAATPILSEIPDEPSPSEMRNLEELNRSTVERLEEKWPEDEPLTIGGIVHPSPPASKPDPQPVTETSSPESPPQKIDEIDEYQDAEKHEAPTVATVQEAAKKIKSDFKECLASLPAEDIELTALKKYIQDSGFVLSTVAYHIVSLCAQPMTTPSTTTWAFKERSEIPAMVLALLNQPGYLEGIWPSLKIVMGSNKGNATWTAGIATTIAFFDVIRTLPAIEELKNEEVIRQTERNVD